jgi:hypothetical protein
MSSPSPPCSEVSRRWNGLSIAGNETYTIHPNFMIIHRDFMKRLSAVHSFEEIPLPKTFPPLHVSRIFSAGSDIAVFVVIRYFSVQSDAWEQGHCRKPDPWT